MFAMKEIAVCVPLALHTPPSHCDYAILAVWVLTSTPHSARCPNGSRSRIPKCLCMCSLWATRSSSIVLSNHVSVRPHHYPWDVPPEMKAIAWLEMSVLGLGEFVASLVALPLGIPPTASCIYGSDTIWNTNPSLVSNKS